MVQRFDPRAALLAAQALEFERAQRIHAAGPENELIVEVGARNQPISGVVGSADSFQHIFKARCPKVQPVTLMVDFTLAPFTPSAMVATDFRTDLLLRWGDSEGGGGEALLDAAHGQVITVCAGTVELLCNHKGNPTAGGDARFSCSGFVGTVPHPRPVRTARMDIAAGAFSPRIEVPAWTSAVRMLGVPEPDALLCLRSYCSGAAVTGPLTETWGLGVLQSVSGAQFIDVENASITPRTVVVVYELAF